ncbi:MAG: DUF1015 domain-containing protein [Syntrophobacterales bacterium]|jgi:uncharacterized protein (DUF1015 family)|nr:DUF1015 domain-containing protein [Syntrophobacterales bacterium]
MASSYTKPFKGIFYNKEKIGDIASCVCPPYDVISDSQVYYKRNLFNAIRLELPDPEAGIDKYINARLTFDEWLQSKVLLTDPTETIYIYEQEFVIGGVPHLRRGFIALNKLDKERILTHEQTRSKAKEDREKLIASLKTFTSLVFGLYEDRNFEIEEVLQKSKKETLYDFIDEQHIKNRFYRMSDQKEIGRLTSLMDERKIYVADGHHRLDVSYRLNIPDIPVYLTNMYSEGVVILPYHRMITFETPRALEQTLNLLQAHVEVQRIPLDGPQSAKRVLHIIASSYESAFGLYSTEDTGNVYIFSARLPRDGGPLERLKVNILHSGLLKGVLGFKEEEISFTQDADELLQSVREKKVDLAFLLPPTTTKEVKEVADNGLYMPPKSTFFYPKISTGLIYYKYA